MTGGDVERESEEATTLIMIRRGEVR